MLKAVRDVEVKITGPNSDGEFWLILKDDIGSAGLVLDIEGATQLPRLLRKVATPPPKAE